MTDSDVQVSPSGGGPNVRTVQTNALVGGAIVAVETQAVVMTNPDGSLVDWNRLIRAIDETNELLTNLLEATRESN